MQKGVLFEKYTEDIFNFIIEAISQIQIFLLSFINHQTYLQS